MDSMEFTTLTLSSEKIVDLATPPPNLPQIKKKLTKKWSNSVTSPLVSHNSVIPALATLCYLVMLRYICKTYRTTGYSYHIASFGAALIGDLVTVFWMVTPYCSRNYPSLREYAMLMATASWTALHVGSGLLYLLTNKHVHRALKKVFRTPNALPFTASGSVQPSSI
uniref:G_PROTEIN_RECEP_F1_2 domain-containing protein n=1 Tax=Steinernema glaseri TaxID=37863 RepID=A0A1I8AKB2_9BILA